MLFFNFVRIGLHMLIQHLVLKGKINFSDFNDAVMFTVGLTVFYHYLPMSVFRRFSFIYAWLNLEYHS